MRKTCSAIRSRRSAQGVEGNREGDGGPQATRAAVVTGGNVLGPPVCVSWSVDVGVVARSELCVVFVGDQTSPLLGRVRGVGAGESNV